MVEVRFQRVSESQFWVCSSRHSAERDFVRQSFEPERDGGEHCVFVVTRRSLERVQARLTPRAVGAAVGHNPVSLVVPCHRMVLKSGVARLTATLVVATTG